MLKISHKEIEAYFASKTPEELRQALTDIVLSAVETTEEEAKIISEMGGMSILKVISTSIPKSGAIPTLEQIHSVLYCLNVCKTLYTKVVERIAAKN